MALLPLSSDSSPPPHSTTFLPRRYPQVPHLTPPRSQERISSTRSRLDRVWDDRVLFATESQRMEVPSSNPSNPTPFRRPLPRLFFRLDQTPNVPERQPIKSSAQSIQTIRSQSSNSEFPPHHSRRLAPSGSLPLSFPHKRSK